jgi:hypothetical protein
MGVGDFIAGTVLGIVSVNLLALNGTRTVLTLSLLSTFGRLGGTVPTQLSDNRHQPSI